MVSDRSADAPTAESFTALYRTWRDFVKREAYFVCRSDADADDVVQIVFLRVWDSTSWSEIRHPRSYPPPGYAIRCAMIVDADAGSSDSGAPVFTIADSPEVEIVGTLFAGWGVCSDGVDPIYTTWVVYCPQFAASNLGGILLDLDPVGNAPITFY